MEKDNISKTAVTSEQLKKELERAKNKPKGGSFLSGLLIALIAVAATVSILTTMFFPIMRIKGDSMFPNVENGSLVVAYKRGELNRGDVCAFYSGNSILCKRIIAFGGEVIDIDENGVVYIDNIPLDEPYITAADFGHADIQFPYLVPQHTYFVMGDNRSVSIDSRNSEIGCVSESQIIGKLVFRFWPFDQIGAIE